jgi:hypothetical protein
MATNDLKDIDLTFRGAYKIDPTFLPVCRRPLRRRMRLTRQERLGDEKEMKALAGVLNLGKIGPEEFARELATSKILVGIGEVGGWGRLEIS